jgi:peptide chain release factor 2
MEEAETRKFEAEVKMAADQLGVNELKTKLSALEEQSQQGDFWKDNLHAQAVMQDISRLKKRIEPWIALLASAHDITELVQLKDPKLGSELSINLNDARTKFDELKRQLHFSGPYDDHGALISVYAGAGGTDAQDWTQMLFRMYCRFFDQRAWSYRIIDESPGEEAGLKSVTLEVRDDDFIYGMLKSEAGVHRLVRLSPFNADHLRQTSFAKVEVMPLIESPSEVELDERELKIDVYRSGGHGGQSVNTTDSAVRVTHLPTNLSVAIQNERSQLKNKETALTILRSRIAKLQMEQHAETLSQLKGPSQSAEWGNQIRSYVLHPYKQVKDLRTNYETSDVERVLDGDLTNIIEAYLDSIPSD